jgi:hypothetical protein
MQGPYRLTAIAERQHSAAFDLSGSGPVSTARYESHRGISGVVVLDAEPRIRPKDQRFRAASTFPDRAS